MPCDNIKAMKHALLENQVLLFLVLLAPSLLLLRLPALRAEVATRRLYSSCGAAGVIVFVTLCALNVSRPGFLWHDEPNILSISAAYLHGEPLYHARHAGTLYSLLYGPSTFLAYSALLRFFPQSMTAIRLSGLAVNLANLAFIYLTLRWSVTWRAALALLPIAIAYLLLSASHLFGVRGDALLILCFTSSLFFVEAFDALPAAIVSGVACGFAVDFKITVVPVVCLLLAMLYRKSGRVATGIAALLSFAVAGGMFLLPGVSLKNYLVWLRLSEHQGFLMQAFAASIVAAAFLVVPGWLLRLQIDSGSRKREATISGAGVRALYVVALCGCLFAGSKSGAGPWHLGTMLPFLMLWTAKTSARCRVDTEYRGRLVVSSEQMLGAIAIAALCVCGRWGYRDMRIIHPSDISLERAKEGARSAELDRILRQYSGRNVAMGYGADAGSAQSADRYKLALAGQTYFIDENAVVESVRAGDPIASALVQRIVGCQDVWLIPHGSEPFATLREGVFPNDGTPYLFPAALRLGFQETHLRAAEGDNYDVWICPRSAATDPS